MEHTPGPWKIKKDMSGCLDLFGEDGDKILISKFRLINQEANAALIAAAPELLECLQEALSELQAVFTWQIENKRISEVVAAQRRSTINKARTEIAKAKGE